jgi:hypothetical protein
MPLIDNKGYGELQKNITPAKPMVTVTLLATTMATAMATAIAFNGNGIFLENSPYFVQAHKEDVPSFPAWCLNYVRPVLNPKGHAKDAF